jgi:hypothetical protein
MKDNTRTAFYCSCGSSLVVNASGQRQEAIIAIMRQNHRDPGHREVTARVAAIARRRYDQEPQVDEGVLRSTEVQALRKQYGIRGGPLGSEATEGNT